MPQPRLTRYAPNPGRARSARYYDYVQARDPLTACGPDAHTGYLDADDVDRLLDTEAFIRQIGGEEWAVYSLSQEGVYA
jgi:hypothetical protein